MGMDKRTRILAQLRVPEAIDDGIDDIRNVRCMSKQDTILHLLAEAIHASKYRPEQYSTLDDIGHAVTVIASRIGLAPEVVCFIALKKGLWSMRFDPSSYLDNTNVGT